MNETIDSVLTFWFGAGQSIQEINKDKKSVWWNKDEEIDRKISDRFRALVNAVADSELDHWRESAKGLLASIICTDQFPRNIYRGTGKSFSFDVTGLELAQQIVATGVDRELTTIQRIFAYLPFEHSEDIALQAKSMELIEQLLEDAAVEDKEIFSGFLGYARRHYEVIERFGRFPHRNEILGRESTDLEKDFLTRPGSSF
jgi:uncharacterized protein (DUF924 family)